MHHFFITSFTSFTEAGEFTLSPTILLRALHEWEQIKDLQEEGEVARPQEAIAKCLAPVFTLPFFQSKTAELVTQVAYHFRFSLEFLYKEGLINRDGSTRRLQSYHSIARQIGKQIETFFYICILYIIYYELFILWLHSTVVLFQEPRQLVRASLRGEANLAAMFSLG